MSNLPIVTLTRAIHKKENQILIGFKYDWVLIDVVKHLPKANWSASPLFMSDDRFSSYGKLAPSSKADFAFVQHMVHQLADYGPMACVI